MKAQQSLIEFTRYTLPKFQPGAHHAQIAEALERVERGECKRLMIFAPPRHTKSELASRRFPAWYLGRHPDKQIITSTYSGDFAQDFGRDVREIVQDDAYRRLFPDVALAEDSSAKGRWHTNQGGMYVAVGVGGPLTGRGADIALIDDPTKNRQDAESQTIKESLRHWYTSTLRTRLMPGGSIILVCTRWAEDDLAGWLLEMQKKGGEQWEVVILPAIRNVGGQDQALWPEWYPLDELNRIRGALGARDWLSLYQQTPTAEEGTYFKREWFRFYDELPKNLNFYMSGDLAVTEDRGDFTELGVWGVSENGDVYAADWWKDQAYLDGITPALLNRAKRWNVLRFIGEKGVIRNAAEPYFDKIMRESRTYVTMEWLATVGDKQAMARSFQAMLSCGRVWFPRTEWAEELIDQLLRFPGGKHDDGVDACGLIGRFLDNMWSAIAPEVQKAPNFNEPLRVADFFQPSKAASW